jgi:hypothetical protein
MITKEDFIARLGNLSNLIPSKTGKASYADFRLENSTLYFQRVNPKTNWDLDIEVLWSIYKTQPFINTTVVKNITGKRVNSPSIAVLMAIGCIDTAGNRL